jgi:HK97 family phage prohead protease
METTFTPADALEVRDLGGGGHALEGLCVPYDVPTTKAGLRPEVFRPRAFASALRAGGKVRLLDENHASGRRPVGVATDLTEGPDGLHGVFRFYNTPEGRAAWENVSEQTYGGLSIGFVPVRERRSKDGIREVLEAQLHHVSLVDEPAYDDAQVLALRAAEADRYAIFRNRPQVIIPADADVPLVVALGRV